MSASTPQSAFCPAQEEALVCFCHGVPEAVIRKAIEQGARTLEAVRAQTRASTGCGGCTCEVERLLAEAAVKGQATAG